MLSRTSKQALNIVDRPITKNRGEVATVSLSAFAYLFSELISFAMDRAGSITELEDRCAGGVGATGERRTAGCMDSILTVALLSQISRVAYITRVMRDSGTPAAFGPPAQSQ